MSSPRIVRSRAGAAEVSGLLALLVGLAAVAFVAWWMVREVPVPPAEKPHFSFIVPVTTAKVALGDVAEVIELVGDVRAPERAQLAFERAGRIADLPIRAGDVVETGAVLARLEDTVMAEEVKASQASLLQAREMAELAVREADRLKKIEDIGATAAEIDRAEAAARNEAAKVAQMEADLALQRARLEQGILLAPFHAEVTTRPVALGSYVDPGDPVCELLSLERREILLELPPSVGASVPAGAPVMLRSDAVPDFQVQATLYSILPAVDPRARTFTGLVRIEKETDRERRLRPGMFVRATIELRGARNARTVPVDCLLETEQGMVLVKVVPGEPATVAHVPVRVLARNEATAAVEPSGETRLEAGDEVVNVGKENAIPGKAIQATKPLDAGARPAAAPAASSAVEGDPAATPGGDS